MITHQQAKRFANQHLYVQGSPWVAGRASRDQRHGVWIVSYHDPAEPDVALDGGALVVTDEGEVYDLSSEPGALDDLTLQLADRTPVSPLAAARAREGEGLALLADLDPDEAAGLAAYAAEQMPWPDVLGHETSKPYFTRLMQYIARQRSRHTIYPEHADMFRAFQLTPYDEVRVVILGQDPYPNPDEADGLCFSVPKGICKPKARKNIDKALQHDNFSCAEHGDLTGWATQGVLLLNAALTVPRGGKPDHLADWRPFTDAVIRLLGASDARRVVFVLWGTEAQEKQGLIDRDRHEAIRAPHPAARKEQTGFREFGTFRKVNAQLEAWGGDPIQWSLA